MKKKKLVLTGALFLAALLALAGCQKPAPSITTPVKEEAAEIETSSALTSQSSDSPDGEAMALEEVISLAQEAYPETDITSIELARAFNDWYYTVESVNDTTEFEMRINAITKEVDRKKEEPLDREDANGLKRQNDKLTLDTLASLEDITAVAEKEAGAGTAVKWELERELATTYWSVTVKEGQQESDVKIDAQTSAVLEIERDD